MNRIPKSLECEKEFFASLFHQANPLSSLVRQGARLMLQKALEEEVTHFLGRGHYKRHKNNPFSG